MFTQSKNNLYFSGILKVLILTIILINLLFTLTIKAKSFDNVKDPRAGTLYLTNNQQERVTSLTLSTNVNMKITGLTARVKVTQTFKNDSDQWMEGKYLFPLPDNAAVDHLEIKIGERRIIGDIKEKNEAKKIYQRAKISGKKASLVEQVRANLFTNSVANIAPFDTVEVTIEYQQDISYDKNKGFSIRFPMTITERYIPKKILQESFKQVYIHDNSANNNGSLFKNDDVEWLLPQAFENAASINENEEGSNLSNRVNLSISLNSGMALQRLTSPTHKILQKQKTESAYDVSFLNEIVKADHDFILNWLPVPSVKPRAALFTERKAGENYLSMMIMPPSVEQASLFADDEYGIAREIVFVIDTSGSMSGVSMRQAKKALSYGLSTLNTNDEFNIIQFDSVTQQLFSNSVQATSSNLQRAKNYIENLSADGGTEMVAAIEASLDGKKHQLLRQVIFLTDGAIYNEAELFKLIEKKLGDSRLYTVGIGSAPNTFFMKKAARFGRGTFTFINDINHAQQKIEALFQIISKPQLTHIKVEWPDNISSEVWPNKIPDLYDGEPLWLKAKVSQLIGEVKLSGRLGQTLWQSTLDLEQSSQQQGMAVLWAREKIASIMNDAYHGQVSEQQKQQIIDTAIEHHLVSQFTSLIAVDKTPSRIAEKLLSQRIKNMKPKGTQPAAKKATKNNLVQYANTGLDLDIELKQSLYLLMLSLFIFFIFRRFL